MERTPQPPPTGPAGTAMAALSAYAARLRTGLHETVHRHRRLLWPAAALLLLCALSGPLLGAWMRWVELPRIVRESDLQPCTEAAAATDSTAAAGDARADAMVEALDAQETALAPRHCIGMRRMDTGTGLRTAAYRFGDGSLFTLHLRARPTARAPDEITPSKIMPSKIMPSKIMPSKITPSEITPSEIMPNVITPGEITPSTTGSGVSAEAAVGAAADIAVDTRAEPLSATAAAPSAKRSTEPGMAATAGTGVAMDPGNGVDTAIAINPAGIDANVDRDAVPSAVPVDTPPAQPAPPPILAATCPVQSRQSLLVLAGLLMVGVVVVLHRLRAGGKFFDFRSVVSEPLRPGEALLLIYAFTLILGTGIGLQFGGCEAAEHHDAVRPVQAPKSLQELMVPKGP